ncbi:uncharacterized protein LOC135484572 [Lineus longissimus]|uniref:uncharacterized protein LOC135484572 n=1 Tax=Lineus longissimus TaxID=88925 RepID=UPI002B4D0B4E
MLRHPVRSNVKFLTSALDLNVQFLGLKCDAMSDSLFKVSSLTAHYPLSRSDLYKDLIPSASKVWFHSGHVFISTNHLHKLTTFDIGPYEASNGDHNRKTLDLTFDLSPLHDVLFGCSDSDDHVVFLIAENGLTQVWSYYHNKGWEKRGTFELCTNCTSNICNVILDNRGCCFYWCEETFLDDGSTMHKICKRSFPTGHGAWTKENIGDVFVLLDDCPMSDLYVIDDNLIIWPRQPCPQGLIIRWLPMMRCLEVHILRRGCVHTQNDFAFRPPSFRDIAMSLVDLWIQGGDDDDDDDDDDDEKAAVVHHPLQNELYMINKSGEVFSIENTKNLKKVCHLVLRASTDSQYFMCQFALCELSRRFMRFYSLSTGLVKQTIDTEHGVGQVLGVWNSLSGGLEPASMIQSVGFYTAKNAFQILMTDCRGWRAEPENIVRMLEAGEPMLAAQKILDGDKSGQMIGHGTPDVLTNGSEFESAAIPLIRLEQRNKLPSPSTAKQVEKFVEDSDDRENQKVSTELNEFISPLIAQYVQLQRDILAHLDNKSPGSQRSRKVEDEVISLIATNGATDLLGRQVQLEMLAEQYPEEVLAAIMKYLNNDTDDTSRAEMKKWKEVLGTEPSMSQRGSILPLYQMTCRLLFLDQPSQLVKFVQVAHSMSEQGFGVPGFSRKTTSLYDRALDAVPDVSKSSIKYDAVVAIAQLLLMSSRPQREHEALRLLLSNEVWEAAISLVAQNTSTCIHCELFNVLFVESLKHGFLAKYTSDIMELIPERVNMLYLLDLMKTHLTSNKDGDEVFCSGGDTDIKVGTIRLYLMKFLEK